MRYADVAVGQTVLASLYRPSHRFFRIEGARLATVLEKGVPHDEDVTVNDGGWSTRTERRHTGQGIRLHVRRNGEWDRQPHVQGETELLPAEYETITVAAKLWPAEGENLARWQAARAAEAQAEAQAAEAFAAREATVRRFAAVGFRVTVMTDPPGAVLIAAEDADRLLAALPGGS